VYENPLKNGDLRKANDREMKNPASSYPPKEKFPIEDK